MATEPGAQRLDDTKYANIHDAQGAIAALFGVEVTGSGGLQQALNGTAGLSRAANTPAPGYTKYSDGSADGTFFFVGSGAADDSSRPGIQHNLGAKGITDAIINTGRADQITVARDQASEIIISDNASHTLYGSSSSDIVVITGNGNNTIYAKDGNNTVTISGDGDNKVTAGAGDDMVVITGGGDNNILTRRGDDYVHVIGNGNNQINTGAVNAQGDDLNNGSGEDIVFIEGGGNNAVKTQDAHDSIYIAGSGNNTIDAGSGNDAFDLEKGAGSNALTGGSGDDLFVIHSARAGNDTIEDFSVGDVLKIADRNSDGKVSLVAGQGDVTSITQVGSDTVITLEQGEKITLKNVTPNQLKTHDDGTFTLG